MPRNLCDNQVSNEKWKNVGHDWHAIKKTNSRDSDFFVKIMFSSHFIIDVTEISTYGIY